MSKPQSEEESVSEVVRWWDDCEQFYGNDHILIGRELDFTINQQHYTDDNESDPQRIKPTTPMLLNQERHKAAQILKNSSFFEVRPRDQERDPVAAAYMKALLNRYIQDPDSEYQDALEDVVDGALAARLWGITVGWDPECEELTFRSRDPRNIFWTPGFKNLHSRRVPYLIIKELMTPAEVERMGEQAGWKNTAGILPDAEAISSGQRAGSDTPIRDVNVAGRLSTETKFVTVLMCYQRGLKQKKNLPAYRALDKGDRYMWCKTCDFKGLPQSYTQQELPKVGDLCPICDAAYQQDQQQPMPTGVPPAQPTIRIDREAVDREVMAYKKGQRLRIIAPAMARELWDGDWEYDTKGFTTLVYSPYNHPVDAIPKSDTYYYRSLACVADAMLRLGYEQMRKAHGIILAPQDSLFDANGEAYAFSEQRDIAYYDNEYLPPGSIQWFQPPGLNSAWPAYYQAIQGEFAANKGTGDVGLTPGQSKDIAVGTIETLVETGEIPVDRHIRRFRHFLSLTLTRATEILRSVLTTEIAVRVLGPDGVEAWRSMRASGLPGVDVVVTAEPDISKEEMDKAKDLIQLASQPPYLRRFVARSLGIDPRLLDELDQAEQAFIKSQQAQQPPPNPQSPGPAANGGGSINGVAQAMPNFAGATQ